MKKTFCLSILLLTGVYLFAADPAGYKAKTFKGTSGVELQYRVLFPENYDRQAEYPLVLFLHGAGERGEDNLKQLTHGSKMFTNPVNMENYPAIVLFPQCPSESYWPFDKRPESAFCPEIFPEQHPVTEILLSAKELVDNYIANERVDKNRVYIIGLSMGGMGAFDMVCRFPDLFTAAIPICGGVNPEKLKSATKVKFRIFHGDIDNVVPVENSRLAYTALKRYGADVEYIEFVGVNHGSWDPAFNYPGFMKWLFSQRK